MKKVLGLCVLSLLGLCGAWATELTLHAVQFPERREVGLPLVLTAEGPRAEMKAEVTYREGQAWIDVKFKEMKPAVLFGGDVTCYVLWAVTRDGQWENLGELRVSDASDHLEFATGLKSFALLLTAEPYFLVEKPSSLVIAYTGQPEKKKIVSNAFTVSDFDQPPATALQSISMVALDSKVSLDLMQAEKAFELAERHGAKEYAPVLHRDAYVALGQARNFAQVSRSRDLIDYARRSVAHSNDAIRQCVRHKQAEALAAEIARRKAEMEALENRAREAENMAQKAALAQAEAQTALEQVRVQKAQADQAVAQVEASLARMNAEKVAMETNMVALREEKAMLDAEKEQLMQEKEQLGSEMIALQEEKKQLQESMVKLNQEKAQLSSRLQDALSLVAETRDSARGFIVNLPDILFDVDKATLKAGAQVVIAKLVGILLVMPDLSLQVEGHTDSTGGDEYNQKLSEKRARSVMDFLVQNGVKPERISARGFGKTRPIADNATEEGRRKNRRVELIINEGAPRPAETP